LFYIRQIHAESKKIYGSPRMTAALKAKGIKCNHKRVESLMREHGILAIGVIYKKAGFVKTKISRSG